MNIKCPCKECICFAICKAKIRNNSRHIGSFSGILRCEILDKFLKRPPNGRPFTARVHNWRQIDATRAVYDLKPLFAGYDYG